MLHNGKHCQRVICIYPVSLAVLDGAEKIGPIIRRDHADHADELEQMISQLLVLLDCVPSNLAVGSNSLVKKDLSVGIERIVDAGL